MMGSFTVYRGFVSIVLDALVAFFIAIIRRREPHKTLMGFKWVLPARLNY
jgi:hypothetical protein